MNNERDICPKCGAYGYLYAEHCGCKYDLPTVSFTLTGVPDGYVAESADTIADISGNDSLTRLVLRDDHINVYVYEEGADPNASQG